MQNELVFSSKWQVWSDSLIFAKNFWISHNEILKKIAKLTGEILPVKNKFIETTNINDRNRKYPKYLLNRDWYMFLVMNISTLKANEIKLKFIKAFNDMEKALLNQQIVSWIETRTLLKEERKEETDKIKEFVEYATKQGSKSANFYYSNITKMTYKALELLNQNKTTPIREYLELADMFNLLLAERKVIESLEKWMNNSLHYKEIYLLAKDDLVKLFEMLPKKAKLLEIKKD